MDKKKIQLIITSFLIIMLFSIISSNLKKSKEETYKQRFSKISKKKASFKHANYSLLSAKFDGMRWGKNPFGPGIVKYEETGRSDSLQGILWDPVSPRVMFRGVLLKIGDNIRDYNILDIRKGSIILSQGKVIYELKVGQSLDSLR